MLRQLGTAAALLALVHTALRQTGMSSRNQSGSGRMAVARLRKLRTPAVVLLLAPALRSALSAAGPAAAAVRDGACGRLVFLHTGDLHAVRTRILIRIRIRILI
jgi:hypothetical protein